MFLLPGGFEPRHGAGRESRGVRAEERLEGLGEVASADALEVEPGDQLVEALGPTQVRRQDGGSEHLSLSHRASVLDSWLLDLDRSQAGEDGPLGVRPVADNLATPGLVLEVGVFIDPGGDLGLNGLGEHLACPVSEDFSQDVMALGQWHDSDFRSRLAHGGVLLCLVGKFGVTQTSPRVRRPFISSIHDRTAFRRRRPAVPRVLTPGGRRLRVRRAGSRHRRRAEATYLHLLGRCRSAPGYGQKAE